MSNPDLYNFDLKEDLQKNLYWMGMNYPGYVIKYLDEQLSKQDPGTEITGLKNESDPKLETKTDPSGKLLESNVIFDVQVLVLSSQKRYFRIYGSLSFNYNYIADKVVGRFDINRSEAL